MSVSDISLCIGFESLSKSIIVIFRLGDVMYIIHVTYVLDQKSRLLNVSFCWQRTLQFKRGHCSRAAFNY